jgi:ABC-type phosphate/phosphonate transport system substrate-binding protein
MDPIIMNLKIRTLVATLLAALTLPAHAELVLAGNPAAKDRVERDKRFTELASQLSEALGEPVRYVAPINEMGYAQEIRKGSYDILIDGPHLGAWRVNKGLHKYVAEVNTPQTFLIIVPATDKETASPDQLISKKVCVLPSPNLSNLMFMNLYPDPLQTPSLHVVDNFNDVATGVLSGKCMAGVINAAFFASRLDKGEREQLRVAYSTRPLPGNIMTVSNNLNEDKRKALQKRITSADPASDKLLQTITAAGARDSEPGKARWQAVNEKDVKGLDQILIQQSYGWQ